MRISKRGLKRTLFSIAIFILWTSIFSIAYSQSPLYTSNQNQYFLHGLARSGYGYLNRDWLANTLDPTPVFSALVEQTYRFLHTSGIFYIFYAFLMGIYLFSLYGIASKVFHINSSRIASFVFLALMILLHSAGLHFALSGAVNSAWIYVLEDGVADQRILGGIFQPSTFGVLLILAIYLFLDNKTYLAALIAALSAVIHPTYLLASGALVISFMLIEFKETRRVKEPLLMGLTALLPILPILLYVWGSFSGTSPEISATARQILVNYRIPHHAVVSQWFHSAAIMKIFLIIFCLILVRKQRIFLVLLVSFIVAGGLTLLQILTNSDALALLFPWRISIYLVPMSTSLLTAYLVSRLTSLPAMQTSGWQKFFLLASIFIIVSAVLIGGLRFIQEYQRKMQETERSVEAYINAHKTQQDVYLTPVKMEGFRLFSGAPVYVDFKSIPYKDTDVLEWYRRVQLADHFYNTYNCKTLESLANDEGVTHAITPNDGLLLNCPQIEETYHDGYYYVYKLLTGN